MRSKLYSKKENRDKAAKELTDAGKTVRKSRVTNQQLHPMYVEDLPDGNTGFGNTEYRTFHSVLYSLEEVRETSGIGWPD